jgi:hypothetical protein
MNAAKRALVTGLMAALLTTSLGFVVPSAHAEPNTGTTQADNKGCPDPEHYGQTLPAGTVWTSTTTNGQVASQYKCNGKTGEWDKTIRTVPSTQTNMSPVRGDLSPR